MSRWGLLAAVGALGVLAVAGIGLPGWMIFLVKLGLAKGLVVLGVVLLLRAGLVSFGQALFYAAGAYGVGFAIEHLGIRDAALLLLIGVGVAVLVAALTGLLIARYREIFFAMLTLAFSMVLYGILVKAFDFTGGTDGLQISESTLFGVPIPADAANHVTYYLTLACVAVSAFIIHRYAQAPLGHTLRAVRDNEVRVAYLGGSVRGAIYQTYVLAGALAGIGGALVAMSVGHIDPNLAYWTTSGEFVFVAILGGIGSVFAPLAASVAYEVVRSYLFGLAPYSWQIFLGAILLAVVLFLPNGLWSLVDGARRRVGRRPRAAVPRKSEAR